MSYRLKNFNDLGMNINSDRFILPEQYQRVVPEPSYRGMGNHSVRELEAICEQFKEYCHQQAIIKQYLIEDIKKG